MHLRQRYQYGCLTRKRRIRGEDVWEIRYYQTTTEGLRRRRSQLVGTVARSPPGGTHCVKSRPSASNLTWSPDWGVRLQ